MNTELQKVLDFWFVHLNPEQWFAKDDNLDKQIQNQFLSTHQKYRIYDREFSDLYELLALIILFDQFSRNMFRNTKDAFEFDWIALEITKQGIQKDVYHLFEKEEEKQFFFMPLMHSENLQDQELSIKLFQSLNPKTYQFALDHHKIIERFGRFPHRNSILERQSTLEEIHFLKTPNSSF